MSLIELKARFARNKQAARSELVYGDESFGNSMDCNDAPIIAKLLKQSLAKSGVRRCANWWYELRRLSRFPLNVAQRKEDLEAHCADGAQILTTGLG